MNITPISQIIRNIQSFLIVLHSDTQTMAENVSHWLDEALLPFSKLLFNLFLDLLKVRFRDKYYSEIKGRIPDELILTFKS